MRRPYYQRGLRYHTALEELPLPEPPPAPARRERLLRLLPFAVIAAGVMLAAITRTEAPPATVLPPLSEEEFAPFIELGRSLELPDRAAPAASAPHQQDTPAPTADAEHAPDGEFTPPAPDPAPASASPTPAARPVTLVDAHAHAVPGVAPAELVQVMDRAGVRQAILLPLGADEETRKAADAFPGRFIPFAGGGALLRLTQSDGARAWDLTATAAQSYVTALEAAVRSGQYRGIGELVIDPPVYADAPLVQALMKLSSDHQMALMVSMNGTAPGIARLERALDAHPAARVVWAGCGGVTAEQARRLLTVHPNLYCDLSGRDRERYGRTAPMADARGALTPAWQALLEALPERFLVGTDARTAADLRGRYPAWAAWHQQWLGHLSAEAASWIADRNISRIIGE